MSEQREVLKEHNNCVLIRCAAPKYIMGAIPSYQAYRKLDDGEFCDLKCSVDYNLVYSHWLKISNFLGRENDRNR